MNGANSIKRNTTVVYSFIKKKHFSYKNIQYNKILEHHLQDIYNNLQIFTLWAWPNMPDHAHPHA